MIYIYFSLSLSLSKKRQSLSLFCSSLWDFFCVLGTDDYNQIVIVISISGTGDVHIYKYANVYYYLSTYESHKKNNAITEHL